MIKLEYKYRQASATAKYIRMSPTKVRRVLKQIQGLYYKDAIMLLEFMPYRCCSIIWKVLYSAVSNAQNNCGLDKQNLFIKKTFADQGPVLKRFRPRAKGRGYQILKPTCHINIIVESTK
uniref:ribosomal protein L22 n=1 Tax=Merotricha bacillata TaxID=658122 RepID=UPI002114A534|nr:ribosomal protein L22 [Merotricha bacillata]UTE94496.1 ribosomal protein L22 [Merotricha bacillata]